MSLSTKGSTERPAKRPTEPLTNEEILLTAPGAFHASAIGYRAKPYPMAGEGSCVVTPHYLIASGFRPRGGRALVVLGAVAGVILLGLGLGQLDLPDAVVVGAPFALFISIVMRPSGASSTAARFRIPLENIAKVTIAQRERGIARGTVMIVVADTKPAGEIRFVTPHPGEFVSALAKARRS
jgi:hypothetical protein